MRKLNGLQLLFNLSDLQHFRGRLSRVFLCRQQRYASIVAEKKENSEEFCTFFNSQHGGQVFCLNLSINVQELPIRGTF